MIATIRSADSTEAIATGRTLRPVGDLTALLRQYRTPTLMHSLWQLGLTVGIYFFFAALMWLSLSWSYWLTLALAIPTGLFLVRIFIIQHDCGHGSFFKSKFANDLTGRVLGVLTMTPYQSWRRAHAMHHAGVGNLDRRGTGGDIQTLTVQEYRRLPPLKRFGYRLLRHPLFFFLILPPLIFVIHKRFAFYLPRDWKKERASVRWTNLGLLGYLLAMAWLIGPLTYVLIFVPTIVIASSIGFWLFFVQHQFEDTYWDKHEEWSFGKACLEGSSYYRLPKALQWLTASIGLHHIHHLDSRIPNYRLQKCLDDNPELEQVPHMTLWQSLCCPLFKLWDEEERRMVGFPRR